MCIHESVVIGKSQKIQASCNVTPYRVVNTWDVLKKGVVFVVRLKQPLFGMLDSYLRVHLGKRPFGRSRRMWKSHVKVEVGRNVHGVEFF